MHLKFFLQLPDNAYAPHSKFPLQFTNFAALMQANVESTFFRFENTNSFASPGH